MKYLVIPAIIAADVYTKHADHSKFWDHERNWSLWNLLVVALLLVAILGRRQYMLAGIVIIVAEMLNWIDGLDGVVTNPYALVIGRMTVGFNIADLCILFGLASVFYITFQEKKKKAQLALL